jgi:deoxyguanosine kinase
LTLDWYAIEGLVGAGKTTTTQLVAPNLRLRAVVEQTDKHPFLAAYYRDPHRFAFETELVFMMIHLHQIKEASGAILSDFSPAKNIIYAERQLRGPDLVLLQKVDQRLWRDLPRPRVAIFLDVPPKICLERIRRRGRVFEQGLTLAYLESLRDGYLARLSTLAIEIVRIELVGDELPEHVAARVADQVAQTVR